MTLSSPGCIKDILDAIKDDESIAIRAPGADPLTYGSLRSQVSGTVEALNSLGYGRNDRIAMVLPNGPDMAVAFLSVAAGFTCMPLNPLYSQPELEFYLSDLNASGLIVPAGNRTSATEAAKRLGVPLIEMESSHKEAGILRLSGRKGPGGAETGFASPEDLALVLHTSGTTSKPKRVPLSQGNICISAHNISTSLRLDRNDLCLNVMPLFHIHGLIGALLSSISAGAGVACTPGFISPDFFKWARELKPTWYTAVPAIHQKVLEMSRSEAQLPRSFRLIRSSSSSLPVSVMRGLEESFGVPVIEAYGMTEASHQIAANPLPPLARKPGSTGIALGTEISILGENGDTLPRGAAGEVAIRGPCITASYENAHEANAAAFYNGWLRTGDFGLMDDDGYLYLLGRLKEIINRGGEKISPFEVEEVLLAYPGIREAAVFQIKDEQLGEEVGAAVVAGESLRVGDLKEFLGRRLAYFKIPSYIAIVDEIPKGPTGKVQRMGMAEKLGITIKARKKALVECAPTTGTEIVLASIWREVLHADEVHIGDNFIEIGGDSLMATLVISRASETLGTEIPIMALFDADDLKSFAGAVDRLLIAREKVM